MSESILKALIQLFALIIDIHREIDLTDSEKSIVRSFLSRQLSSELTEKYMVIFEEYLDLYHEDDLRRDQDQVPDEGHPRRESADFGLVDG